MSSILNYFYSNPFNTQIGQLIEKSTDGTQVSEDWASYMQICDLINSSEDGPRDGSRAIRKQLFNCAGKNTASVLFTLTVLETCVKNCGRPFHLMIAQKDFLQDLVKILSMKPPLPHIAQEKILGLLQMWEEAFKNIPELQEVGKICAELREKNFEFPMLDMLQAAPINTPTKRLVEKVETTNSLETNVPANPPSPISTPHQDCVVVPASLDALKVAKLRSELDIVTRNCNVFNEMLSLSQPGSESQDDWLLMQELGTAVLEMRKRIVQLIDRIQFEQLTSEMIPVCDEVNNVLLRFERYGRARKNKSESNLIDMDDKASDSAIMSEMTPSAFNPFSPLADSTNPVKAEYKAVEMEAVAQGNQKASKTIFNPYTNQELSLDDPNQKNNLTSSSDFDRFLASKSNISSSSDNSKATKIISADNHVSNGNPVNVFDTGTVDLSLGGLNINGDVLNERGKQKTSDEHLFDL